MWAVGTSTVELAIVQRLNTSNFTRLRFFVSLWGVLILFQFLLNSYQVVSFLYPSGEIEIKSKRSITQASEKNVTQAKGERKSCNLMLQISRTRL